MLPHIPPLKMPSNMNKESDVFAIPRKVSTLDMQYSVSTDLMTVEFSATH